MSDLQAAYETAATAHAEYLGDSLPPNPDIFVEVRNVVDAALAALGPRVWRCAIIPAGDDYCNGVNPRGGADCDSRCGWYVQVTDE